MTNDEPGAVEIVPSELEDRVWKLFPDSIVLNIALKVIYPNGVTVNSNIARGYHNVVSLHRWNRITDFSYENLVRIKDFLDAWEAVPDKQRSVVTIAELL